MRAQSKQHHAAYHATHKQRDEHRGEDPHEKIVRAIHTRECDDDHGQAVEESCCSEICASSSCLHRCSVLLRLRATARTNLFESLDRANLSFNIFALVASAKIRASCFEDDE